MSYQWQQKPNGGSEGCDMQRVRGADSSTLAIPSIQHSNEGSYHSNGAGNETSDSATLTVGELKIMSYSSVC